MPQLLLAFVFLFTFAQAAAQTTVNGSFVHGGITRTYSLYIPASYMGQGMPLLINLHGYTSSAAQQTIYGDFRPIADTAGFIIVHPDGSLDPVTSQPFWNFGIFGATVNDISFLEALIDTVSDHYAINQRRVYSVGMSNGGFMAYALACQTDRFAAIGSVTGSMSVPMYNSCNPVRPIPVIHIHGTDDTTNPYAGNSSSKGIQDVVEFWADKNNCAATPVVTQVPNVNTSDNATAEQHLYSGGTNGHTVEHFKVTGGGHTWPGSGIPRPTSGNTCMDFSASKEIWRFFSQYERSIPVSVADYPAVALEIYPNPSQGTVHIESGDYRVTAVIVTDMQGRVVASERREGIRTLELSHLKAGNYLVHLSGADFQVVRKWILLPH